MKGLTAGIVAGLAGAFAWALIAYFTGFEIGYLAWGIGALVGAAVGWGTKGTPTNGVIAVAISIVAIMGGKFMAVQFSISNEMETIDQDIALQMENEEFILSWLAGGIIYEIQEQGNTVQWPAGVDPDEASAKEDFPPEIWNATETVWAEMTDDEKEEFRGDVKDQINANIQVIAAMASKEGFLSSFGLFDAIFFFLAIGTAYKVAAKTD